MNMRYTNRRILYYFTESRAAGVFFFSVCSWSVVSAKAVGNQMAPPCAEWWGEMANWATTPFSYCPSTAFLPVRSHCMNARLNRCQEDL